MIFAEVINGNLSLECKFPLGADTSLQYHLQWHMGKKFIDTVTLEHEEILWKQGEAVVKYSVALAMLGDLKKYGVRKSRI